jgi:hypothetical protein
MDEFIMFIRYIVFDGDMNQLQTFKINAINEYIKEHGDCDEAQHCFRGHLDPISK